MQTLDLDLVRTFVCVAGAKNFTVAGTILGASQSAVSVRIKKLEEQLKNQLLNRTPRTVSLTEFGNRFLADARRVLNVHDDAMRRALNYREVAPLTLGVSDHAAGAHLPNVLAQLRTANPGLQLRVCVDSSENLEEMFEAGKYDAVIIRPSRPHPDSITLFRERIEWFCAPEFVWDRHIALPLLSLGASCKVRELAVDALEEANLKWVEVFTGSGVAAVQAAVMAGLGVACLDRRNRPAGAITLGQREDLPTIQESEIVLLKRPQKPSALAAIEAVGNAFKALG